MSATSSNGDRLVMVGTNMGFTTDKIAESGSATGGLPILGGSYDNDTLTSARESTQPTVITVGLITVSGVVDQSTGIDVAGGWLWRQIRTVVTAQVFKTGLNGYFGNQNAQVAADVTKSTAETGARSAGELAKIRSNTIQNVNPELVPIEALKSP